MKTHDADVSEESQRDLAAESLPGKRAPGTKVTRSGRWFRRSRRWHDPMLVLNMSIFNSDRGCNRVFNPIPQRENIWC
jgi:hypothetical protein